MNGLGDFTATAHKITDKGVLFIFDDYVVSKAMNEANTNEGGFEESDLKKWIDSVLLEKTYSQNPAKPATRNAGYIVG